MFRKSVPSTLALLGLLLSALFHNLPLCAQSGKASLGIFQGQSDIGTVTPPGTAVYDAAAGTYTLSAAGADMWSEVDDFHFLWKKATGDLSLTASISFPDKTGTPHPRRKAVLMLRQTLDTDSGYADATQHGSGGANLQYRLAKGAKTQDIELKIGSPQRIRLEKRGDVVTMFLSMNGEPLHPVGASMKLHLTEPFYVGLGVCSHDEKKIEKAVFSNVEWKALPPSADSKAVLFSTLKTVSIEDDMRQAVVRFTAQGQFEAPNWTRDGKSLIFDQGGRIMTVSLAGGDPSPLDIGAATHCNGSHGLSPDGKWLAITCAMPDKPEARIYIVPSTGGTPRLVTEHPLSYWHSWSPDGRTIAFARPDHGSGNIGVIAVEGGAETLITSGTGISDDPDYSPDGKYIYFNSDRGGGMQIWRMHPDGSAPEQMTFDERMNWTPHVSPDGKQMIFMSYEKGVTGHPANKDVEIRLMSLEDRKVRTIVNIIGGTGTMNVPAWAPDSRHFAFVSYQLLPEAANLP